MRDNIFIIFTIMMMGFMSVSAQQIKASRFDELVKMSLEELMDVEITSAGKISQKVGDVPASTTIISRDEIARYGYKSLTDIIENIPGMYLLDNTESLFIGIRGTSGGGVQFLVNGIPQHPSLQKGLYSTDFAQFNISVESIDRIEMIRGPMSVIYGNNAFLGVINIITNEKNTTSSQAVISGGSRNSGSLFGRYGVHNYDSFLVINAGLCKTDGLNGSYADMLDADQLAELHPAAVKTMDKEADHKHRNLDISAKYKSLTANFRYSFVDYDFYPTSPGLGGNNNIKLTTLHGSLEYETDISQNTSVRATAVISTEKYYIPEQSLLIPTLEGSQIQTSRRSDVEIDVISKINEFEVVSGYRYRFIDNLFNDFIIKLSPDAVPLVDFEDTMADIHLHEVFSQASFQLTSCWTMTGGLRYLRLPQEYSRVSLVETTGIASTDVTAIKKRNQFTGRLALICGINDNHQLKFLAGTAAQDRDEFVFSEPEKITTYEINYNMTFSDFYVSASLFYNSINNILQRSITFDANLNMKYEEIDNSGDWESYGLEIITKLRVNKNLQVSGSMTVQESRDQIYNVKIGYAPGILAKFKTDYKKGPIGIGLYGYYVGSMKAGYQLIEPDNKQQLLGVPNRIGDDAKGYLILSANLRYEHKSGIFVSLHGKNLLNSEFRYPANELAIMKRGLIGMGRVISAAIGYKF